MAIAYQRGCRHCGCACGEKTCVSRVPMFSALPPDLLEQVAQALVRWDAEARSALFRAGEGIRGLYIIRYGAVKLVRWDAEGNEHILGLLKQGDFYGGNSLFHAGTAQETAICTEKTGICLLPEQSLRELLLRQPQIALQLIRWYSAMHQQHLNLMEVLTIKDMGQRVMRFLALQTEDVVTLTQEEVARMIGMTPETLNRKLAALKRQGIIRTEGHRRIRILQREKLMLNE